MAWNSSNHKRQRTLCRCCRRRRRRSVYRTVVGVMLFLLLLSTVILLVKCWLPNDYHLLYNYSLESNQSRQREYKDKSNQDSSSMMTTTTATTSPSLLLLNASRHNNSADSNASTTTTTASSSNNKNHQNRIIYVGKFGLGHRLSKMAAAYHLAQRLATSSNRQNRLVSHIMEVRWGICQAADTTTTRIGNGDDGNSRGGDKNAVTGGPIFDYLFGDSRIPILAATTTTTNPAMMTTTRMDMNNNDGEEVVAIIHHNASATTTTTQQVSHKEFWIRNDCHGYYAGQNFKNARQAIPRFYTQDHIHNINNNNNSKISPFFQKMDSDIQLFQLLQDRFETVHSDPQDFMRQYQFADRTVVGLHIRAGNGEQDHFVHANRVGATNADEFLSHLLSLLETFLGRVQQQQQQQQTSRANNNTKPLLLFVATDTPTVIPVIRQAVQSWNEKGILHDTPHHGGNNTIQVVTFPQPQLPPSGGVTYSQVKKGQQCLVAWKAMMVDMILLSHADVVIAAMRSSFTQIMPLSMVFHRHNHHQQQQQQQHHANTSLLSSSSFLTPRFCEVSDSGRSMTCVQDREAWLFRNVSKEWTLTLDDDDNHNILRPEEGGQSRVVHKVMVHFPDIDEDDVQLKADIRRAVAFLSETDSRNGDNRLGAKSTTNGNATVWGNGKTINQKYRKKSRGKDFTSEWTFLRDDDGD